MLVTALDSPTTDQATTTVRTIETSPEWHVLWSRSHCEQLVHDQLVSKGFRVFLPTVDAWSRRGGIRRVSRGPMADVEGILVRSRANKGLLVLSVDLVSRSVAVEVDCTLAVPV